MQLSKIGAREILHAHAAVALMRAKNALQLSHHGSVVRMTFRGSERAAAQTPAESLPIQNLIIRQVAGLKPMEGLSGGHELHAGVQKRGGLSGAVYAGKAVVGSEMFFAGLTHGFVGLD